MYGATFIIGIILLEFSHGLRHYTDQWAVNLSGGERMARDLALKHGFEYMGQVGLMSMFSIFLLVFCPFF